MEEHDLAGWWSVLAIGPDGHMQLVVPRGHDEDGIRAWRYGDWASLKGLPVAVCDTRAAYESNAGFYYGITRKENIVVAVAVPAGLAAELLGHPGLRGEA